MVISRAQVRLASQLVLPLKLIENIVKVVRIRMRLSAKKNYHETVICNLKHIPFIGKGETLLDYLSFK